MFQIGNRAENSYDPAKPLEDSVIATSFIKIHYWALVLSS